MKARPPPGVADDVESGLGSVRPSWQQKLAENNVIVFSDLHMKFIRITFGLLYLFVGIGAFIVFFASDEKCLKLSRQVTAPGQDIGRANTVGVSKSAGPICAPAINASIMLVSAAWMLSTGLIESRYRALMISIYNETNGLHWLQLAVQGSFIILVILTMVGAINVFEVALAPVVVLSSYIFFAASDNRNAGWALHRAVKKSDERLATTPLGKSYTAAEKAGTFEGRLLMGNFEFWGMAYFSGILTHAAVWIISLIHFIQSYGTHNLETGFVTAFIIVSLLQQLIPIVKILCIRDVWYFSKTRVCVVTYDLIHLASFCTIAATFIFS